MAGTHFTMDAVLAQQTERTRGSSTSQLKQLIAESDSKIILLENEMAALESRMAALVELRDLERATGDAFRFLAAPIRTLPVELLAEIFLLSIRELDLKSGFIYSMDWHIQDAFRVSHVCRRWRQIANTTPRLWTGPISLDLEGPRHGQEGIYLNGLDTWLARSAPLPVPITIVTLEKGSRSNKSDSRALDALLCISARWRSLRFVAFSPAQGWFVQRLTGCRLDCLEELFLSSLDHDSADSHFDGTAILSFMTASRLRKVAFNSSCGIPMPWAQLTDITLGDILSPETFCNIFSQCINAVKVSISIRWLLPPPARRDALALNQLRVLSITWVGHEIHGMQFLHSLSALALDELRLFFEDGDGTDWDEATLTAFQLRSPNITKLKIEGDGMLVPSHALIAVFRHAPCLTHFSIVDCPDSVDDHFCQALCYTDGVEPLVPRLHTLAVAEFRGNLSQDGLANTIASRWWSDADAELASRSGPPVVARWRQIRLRDDSIYQGFGFSPKFRETMNALQETGLDVDLVDVEFWELDW
ncbi:F-box domain-containing protein [Mycena sanguinolenta]|uniref:F-box domain-containing protein n=1 Tax=Mycena sanguinolenta TaxID=230812 RepID=A0A8H6YEP0_9AGAR|nr:F-box domain-containing protein [Mycena sanguinolenta]